MLVVKPNPRRMRYMRESPSERPGDLPRTGLAQRVRWDRVALATAVAAIVIVSLMEVAARF